MQTTLPSVEWKKKNKRGFFLNQHGIAALEFALCAPLLLLLTLGTIEMSRFLLIHQKAEKMASSMADLIAQSQATTISIASITLLFNAASQVMNPFTFGSDGIVIITSVTRTGSSQPTVRWRQVGGGSLTGYSSQIGAVNATATLPVGMVMSDKENLIVAEVYYRYTPMFGSQIVSSNVMYKTAYFKPRLGALTTPPT